MRKLVQAKKQYMQLATPKAVKFKKESNNKNNRRNTRQKRAKTVLGLGQIQAFADN